MLARSDTRSTITEILIDILLVFGHFLGEHRVAGEGKEPQFQRTSNCILMFPFWDIDVALKPDPAHGNTPKMVAAF